MPIIKENYEDPAFCEQYIASVHQNWATRSHPLFGALGTLRGKTVVDVGSGPGVLTSALAKKARSVIGIDSSRCWIDYCQSTYHQKNVRFVRADAGRLTMIPSRSADVVVMNMVMPHIASRAKLARIFREAARILKPGGRYLVSDLHPVGVMTADQGHRHHIYPRDFSYTKEGSRFDAVVRLGNGAQLRFFNRHWPMSSVSSLLEEAGFSLGALLEPMGRQQKIPEYLVYCCRRSS